MQAHKDFIVHIPERYRDTVKTKGGVDIQLDKNFSGKELANNIFEVINVPVNYQGEIKPGCRLVVDPIVVHNQTFQKWGEEENQYLVDRKKNHYRVDPSLIVCYSMGEGTKFKGFRNNLLCEKYEPEELEPKELEKIGSIFIPEFMQKKQKDTPALRVFIGNSELEDIGVEEDDLIFYKPEGAIDFRLGDLNLVWLRNTYVLGKLGTDPY